LIRQLRCFPAFGAALVVFVSMTAIRADAATVQAHGVSQSDLEWAIAKAGDGDVVAIPEGTGDWTRPLVVRKSITLQGAGPGKTVVNDSLSGVGGGGGHGGKKGAKVNEGFSGKGERGGKGGDGKGGGKNGEGLMSGGGAGGGGGGKASVFIFEGNGFFRLTGITIKVGKPTGGSLAAVQVKESVPTFRIDHCDFAYLRSRAIYVHAERGVIDHNTFEYAPGAANGVTIHHSAWGGGRYGDTSWAKPLELGSDHAVFIEDNTFTNSGGHVRGATDSYAGARWVFRYNTLVNCFSANHGTESSGRFRGTRSWEIYKNTFRLEGIKSYQDCTNARSGTGVIWDNKATGGWERITTLANYRDAYYSKRWGGADGRSGWDLNDPHGVFLSGTYAGENGSQTLHVPNAGWKDNQWLKYTLRNITQDRFSLIVSNTSDTINYKMNVRSGAPMTFNNGDHFEIRRVLQALDHPGASTCDLLVGDSPPPQWLNQKIDPVYFWDNTLNGKEGEIKSSYNVIEGKDYIMGTPKPGYKPYEYPHPLVKGADGSKQAK
jgi:hypothetical protein